MEDLTKTEASSVTINNTIYTPDELEVLDKTKNIRLSIVNNMTKGGIVPEKVGEIRVLNELLTAMDKNAHDSANARLKHSDTQSKESIAEMVTNALHTIGSKQAERTALANSYIPVEVVPTDIVDGEIEIHPEPLNPAEFLGEE